MSSTATERKIRRFDLEADLLAWTPLHDGQYARALDTGNTWRYYAELGWVQQTDQETVTAEVAAGVSPLQDAIDAANAAAAAAATAAATAQASAAAAQLAVDEALAVLFMFGNPLALQASLSG